MAKKSIAIVRGLMPRLTQAEFAGSFRQLNPVFITGESGDEIKSYCQEIGLEQRDLPIRPLWGIDPVRLVLGRRTHQSWVGPNGLLNVCRDLDVLETYEPYHLFSGQAAGVAEKLDIPLVCEVWASFAHLGYRVPPYALAARKVLRQAVLFVARSKRAARALTQLGVSEDKIGVIYHGVNLERFYPPGEKGGGGELRVLFVGSLEPSKGVSLLLDVWPRVLDEMPNARLWLVGKGSLLARAQKMGGVRAFGYMHHTKLPEIYRSADIFVSPSQNRYLGPFFWWEEMFGYVFMEALASGLPVVSTRCGAIPEVVGEENLLVEQGDADGLCSALRELIEDEERREALGKANRARAEKIFDLKKQTARLEDEVLRIL